MLLISASTNAAHAAASSTQKATGKSGQTVGVHLFTCMIQTERQLRQLIRQQISEAKKKGLWHNIHAKRKRGERPAKPGEEGYPETLDIEESEEPLEEKESFSLKSKHKSKKGGLTDKGRKAYNKATGSNLKRPQPEGGKRRTSYCARSKGQQDMHNIDCRKDPDKRICKARRRWNC